MSERTLRAYVGLALLIAGWVAWRMPVVRADLNALRALGSAVGRPQPDPDRLPEDLPNAGAVAVPNPFDGIFAQLTPATDASSPHRARADWAGGPRIRLDPTIFRPDGMLLASVAEDIAVGEGVVPVSAASSPPPEGAADNASRSAAERGYDLLAAGDRRRAAAAFREAIVGNPGDSRVGQWQAQLAYLEKRWTGAVYTLARNSGKSTPAASIPALTAAQSGAQLAYTLNPLSHQPFALQGRVITANDGIAVGSKSAQGAVALTWRPVPEVQVAAERLVRLGTRSRNAWTVRVVVGGESVRPPGVKAWNAWSVYGETGIIGTRRQDLYAASAMRAGRAFGINDKVALTLGAGVWSSVQHYDRTAHWIEVGPTAQLRVDGEPPLNVALDYRWRINGNADPGTGPALTVSTGF